MKYNLNLNTAYDFNLYAPAILGATIKKATLLGNIVYSDAMKLMDVNSLHSQIYATLPQGTSKDASKLSYLKIKTASGSVSVLAEDWISQQPTLSDFISQSWKVSNITASDIPKINALLRSGGYASYELL